MVFPLIILLLLIGTIVVCGIGKIFWPLVLLCKIGILDCDADGGGEMPKIEQIVTAFRSDGRGALNTDIVPATYLRRIQEAGEECTQIGAIVIVSQIQQESAFNEKLVGPDGAEGISQVPPDKFKEFGKDDDGNGTTSGLDAADSIRAQGRYMCSLANEIDTLVANNEVKGDRLDLTLAAYELGLDAVKQAKGMPEDERAQSYIIGVRSGFTVYSAAVDLPKGKEYPTLSPAPLAEQSPAE